MGSNKKLKAKALNLLKDFTCEYLHDNINELANFSFWDIAGNPKYDGTCTPNSLSTFDGDRTKIVYAIERIIYNDDLFSKNSNFVLGQNITGDTINTFNTLFGGRKNYRDSVLKKFGENAKSIYSENEKNDFYHIYQSLGNFTLLPCKTLCGVSINSYRGLHSEWKDFFYPFICYLKKTYQIKDFNSYSDKNLYELSLLRKENDFFFENIDFDKFIDIFVLNNYEKLELPEYLKRVQLYDSEKNRNIALVTKANNFIKNRSKILINNLKKKLDETDFPKEYLN